MERNNNGEEKKRFKSETYVIILQVTKEVTIVEEPNPMLGTMGLPIRRRVEAMQERQLEKFRITEPTLIIPESCDVSRLEVIPITKDAVIHGLNIKRLVTTQ